MDDIRYEYHGTFRGVPHWSAWDAANYDGDPVQIGEGESPEMALVDLLDKATNAKE